MNVTILAALFAAMIIAFFAFMSWAADKKNVATEADYYEIPAYKRKLNAAQLTKLEADLESYKPTVREYYLPRFYL